MAPSHLPVLLEVDLARSRRDRPSQLGADLHGQSVLDRTVERVLSARDVGPVVLVVHEDEAAAARTLLGDRPVEWFTHRTPDIPGRARSRRARRWGKEGWRGGLGGALFVSEAGNPAAMEAAARQREARAVLVVPADAPLVDPTLLTEIATAYDAADPRWLYLSTAAPGLAGDVFHLDALSWLREQSAPVHALLPLRPDDENTQYEQRGLFHTHSEDVTQLYGRFTADTGSALAQLAGWLAAAGNGTGVPRTPAAAELPALLRMHPELVAGPVPEELVVELGSDQGGTRAPRPANGSDVHAMDPAVWQCVLAAVAARDDALLTLGGGHHDPLLDPALPERLAEARQAGALGLHVATPGATIDDARARALLAAPVDVISVELGAPDATSLAQIAPHTPEFADRVRGLEALLAARPDDGPFIVAGVTLREETASRWESFYEQWFTVVDAIVVHSPEQPDGAQHPAALGRFTPPERFPCLRLGRQLRIEADGRVPLCDRDPTLAAAAGRLPEQSVAELWQGARLGAARAAHREGAWDTFEHCGPCVSWCRLDAP